MSIKTKWEEVKQIEEGYPILIALLLEKTGEITLTEAELRDAWLDRNKIIRTTLPNGDTIFKVIYRCSKCHGTGSIECPNCKGSGYPIKED